MLGHMIRRFGIYPKADPSEQDPPVGRSLVSPRMDPREPAADPGAFESAWTEAESWQSYVFGGPTTKEVTISISMAMIMMKATFYHLLTVRTSRS